MYCTHMHSGNSIHTHKKVKESLKEGRIYLGEVLVQGGKRLELDFEEL